jgi:hypothetical protein
MEVRIEHSLPRPRASRDLSCFRFSVSRQLLGCGRFGRLCFGRRCIGGLCVGRRRCHEGGHELSGFSARAFGAFVLRLSAFVIFPLTFGDRVSLFSDKSLSVQIAGEFSAGVDAGFRLRVLRPAIARGLLLGEARRADSRLGECRLAWGLRHSQSLWFDDGWCDIGAFRGILGSCGRRGQEIQ